MRDHPRRRSRRLPDRDASAASARQARAYGRYHFGWLGSPLEGTTEHHFEGLPWELLDDGDPARVAVVASRGSWRPCLASVSPPGVADLQLRARPRVRRLRRQWPAAARCRARPTAGGGARLSWWWRGRPDQPSRRRRSWWRGRRTGDLRLVGSAYDLPPTVETVESVLDRERERVESAPSPRSVRRCEGACHRRTGHRTGQVLRHPGPVRADAPRRRGRPWRRPAWPARAST